jgi:hypothetical protein
MSRIFPRIGEMNRWIDVSVAPGGREAWLLLVAAAVNTVLFAAVLSCLTVGYESNDDVRMMAIASGLITGKPSQYLIVTSVLIGYVLKHLYEWTDRVNWYTLYVVAVHFATMTGLLYAFLRVRFSRTSVVLFVLLFAQFEVAQLLLLQFTSTAVMAAAVGVLLLIASSTPEAGKSRFAVAYGALLTILSGMIRNDSMYYAIMLLAPFLAYELAIRRHWRTFGTIGAFLAVALVAVAFNEWYYRTDPSWRPFREYAFLLRRVMDSPLVDYEENTRFFFDRIGWSHNDWSILKSAFWADMGLFSPAHLRSIIDRFQGSSWGRTGAQEYFEGQLSSLSVFRRMMYANILLAVVLCRGRRLRLLLLGACECLLIETFLVAFANYAKLAPRVILPAFDTPSVIVFFEVLQTTSESRFLAWRPVSTRIRGVAAMAAVAFCLWYALFCYRVASRHLLASESNAGAQRGFRTVVRSIVGQYVDPEPKVVFFDWAGAFPWHFMPPFDDSGTVRRFTTVHLDGWELNRPEFADTARRLGLGNLFHATYENPSVYLFTPRPHYLLWLKRFAQEHYQQKIFRARNHAFLVDTDSPAAAVGSFEIHVYQMAVGTPPPGVVAKKSGLPAAARREDSPERRAPDAAHLTIGL